MGKGKQFQRTVGVMLTAALFLAACGQREDTDKVADVPLYGEEELAQQAEFLSTGLQAELPENLQITASTTSQVFVREPEETPAVQIAEDEELPIDETYFPDEAFREYIQTYVDKDRNHRLSRKERDALCGLGSVKCPGGLLDGSSLTGGLKQAEKLRAIKSFEGISYFENLEEIYFEGGYALQKLPLDNPNLKSVYVKCNSIQEFSIENGIKLTALTYRGAGTVKISWETLTKLADLELTDVDISLKDLLECGELQNLSLTGGSLELSGDLLPNTWEKLAKFSLNSCSISVPEERESLDFAIFPNLREFSYSGGKEKDCLWAKELLFQNNVQLNKVIIDNKISDRIILPNMDVYFEIGGDSADCEVLFAEELLLDTKKVLPQGSIWLNAQNFPDAVFRQYLYEYADHDKNYILTELELKSVRELSGQNDLYLSKIGRFKSETLLKRIRSFQGIEYLQNLRVLRLNEGAVVKELYLDHPLLTELLLPSTLTTISIKNPDNLKKLTFHSREGMELDLGGMYALEEVSLSNITADFSKLLQNKNLSCVGLKNCSNLGKKGEVLDFSDLRGLSYLAIVTEEELDTPWADSIRFGSENSYTKSGTIYLSDGVTNQVILPEKGFQCEIEGDASKCEIIYQ